MQIDPMLYTELKKKGGVKLIKMGGTEGQPDEQVDGVAVLFVKKYDQHNGVAQMPDMGPINLQELLAVKAQFQARIDGVNAMLADMDALLVPTKMPEVVATKV